MEDNDIDSLLAAIAALETQRGTLGDAVLELATAPLRARLGGLQRPSGLQRRQVTVLFADVVGSTAMASGLDEEDTLHILSSALQRMATVIEAHQGRVLKFTGDGVKAAFGMDEKREDDAERAVRAGLAVLAAGRLQAADVLRQHSVTGFAVRVGVHTGDVALGAGVEADNTAMGAAVHIAARMEQSAPPGALRISHDTWSQVRGLFNLQAQPPLLVKGVEAPMQTYLVHAALERGAASVERGLQGLTTPLVGRNAELQHLLQVVERARQTRQLQALTLVGDAGLGKSRLVREGMAVLQDCRLITLRSQPDSQLRPWGLLRSLLALQCGVADTDSADVAKRKVVEGLIPWFADPADPGERGESGQRQAQLIGQLSGLDFADSPTVKGLDPRTLRDQALLALRAYLQALAAQGSSLPVLVVEDLHWADDSSLDLLQHLLAHAAELPLALVMTARPPLLVRRPDWAKADTGNRANLANPAHPVNPAHEPDSADSAADLVVLTATAAPAVPEAPSALMTLNPLPAVQSAALVQALLQRLGEVPPRLSELINSRAEGNPYYMEELVRRLIDDRVIDATGPRWSVQLQRLDTVRLPGTLVGLLQARLDALPTDARQAVRQASIIGHVFWDDALLALDAQAPQALPALQRAAFVKARDSSDFEGTPERQFDHHLLHQVTYDTLLKAERRLGHGAAARWLQARTQGRGAEFLAMTGEHAERAGETALAIDCFEQAGRDAQKRFANAIAQSYFRRALALLGQADPGRSIDFLSALGKIADVLGDRASQDATHAAIASLLERHPDDARQAELLFARALLADRRSDAASAERLSQQAVELAEHCGAARWAAMAHAQLGWTHITRYDYTGARRHLQLGLTWAGKIECAVTRAEIEAQLFNVLANVQVDLCELDEARGTLTAVLSRGESIGQPRLQLGALSELALVASLRGRWDETVAWAERMRAMADAIGSRRDCSMAQLRLAEAAEGLGDAAAALRWHEQNLDIHRATGDKRMEAITLRFLADLHLAAGQAQAALDCCAQSQALHEDLSEPGESCRVEAIAAQGALGLGQIALALERVNATLDRLPRELADCPAYETIPLRWTCQQVLHALGDARAMPLLEQLHADVQATVAQRTDAADRERLIQAIAHLRDIVAAYRRRSDIGRPYPAMHTP